MEPSAWVRARRSPAQRQLELGQLLLEIASHGDRLAQQLAALLGKQPTQPRLSRLVLGLLLRLEQPPRLAPDPIFVGHLGPLRLQELKLVGPLGAISRGELELSKVFERRLSRLAHRHAKLTHLDAILRV